MKITLNIGTALLGLGLIAGAGALTYVANGVFTRADNAVEHVATGVKKGRQAIKQSTTTFREDFRAIEKNAREKLNCAEDDAKCREGKGLKGRTNSLIDKLPLHRSHESP